MTRLQIIDQETRDELAEFGMVASRRIVLCRDCRFAVGGEIGGRHLQCEIDGREYCTKSNPRGECERFEPQPPVFTRWLDIGTNVGLCLLGFILGAVFL